MNIKPSPHPQRPRTLAEQAKISPSSVYEHPREVVRSHVLTAEQKADVLNQWEADAIAMQTAADEGMSGGAPSRLDDVQKAQIELHEITTGRRASQPVATGQQTIEGGSRHDRHGPRVITDREARSAVTGNNVRYVLAASLIGIVVAFIIVGRYLGAF